MKRYSFAAIRPYVILFALALFTFADAQAQRPSRGGGGGGGFSGSRGGGMSRGGTFGGGGFRGGSIARPAPGINRGAAVNRDRGAGYNRPGYRPPVRSNYWGNRGGYWGGGGWGGYGYGSFYRPWGWGYGGLYAPYVGLSFGYLPFGYSSFMWGPNMYYYNDGFFYRQYSDNDYRIVEPPIGAEVRRIPRDAKSVTIDGQQFLERDGVYYQEAKNAKGKRVYKVVGRDGELATNENGVAPIVGDVVDQLPADSRPITLNNVRYYVSPTDVYYEEMNDSGKTQYRVVRTPESEKSDPNTAKPDSTTAGDDTQR